MIRKRVTTFALAAAFAAALIVNPSVAFADTSAELQAQLDAANATLNSLYSQAEEASEKVNETQSQLDQTNTEIETKQAELEEAQDVLASRVTSTYKTGGVSLISILFDSSSFEDLISRIYYASKVSASDAQVIKTVKDIQEELDTKKSEQEQLLSEQQTQKAELESAVSESESYVNSLSAELQEAIAAERAAAEAEAARAAAEAAAAAEANGGNYVNNTDENNNAADNASNNNAADNTSNSNTSNNNNSNSNNNSSNNNNSTTNNTSNNTSNNASSGLTQAQRNAIVSAAWSKVGCSYVYGANGPSSFDCSGFTKYCYAAAGISLPRTSGAQGGWGKSTSNPQAGDLVCWGGHVGIYMGGGMMIDAGNPSVGVSYRVAYSGHWFRTAA